MTKCYVKDYPRPQFVRVPWENLNGIWDFAFDDDHVGEKQGWYREFKPDHRIEVPFSYETRASGIGDPSHHDQVWYHRSLTVVPQKLTGSRVMLHMEGCDYVTKVWVNGQFAGTHQGGYSRFSFDITDLLTAGANSLVVKAEDSADRRQPRGKQRWMKENFECWYVQTTGIWKTVWIEYVPEISVTNIKLTPNLRECCLDMEYQVKAPQDRMDGSLLLETVITLEGELIGKTYTALCRDHGNVRMDVTCRKLETFHEGISLWTPEKPTLYDLDLRILDGTEVYDQVGSYFGMREIRVEGSNVLLNGHPLYQRLILDQGYWKESHLTPPNEESLITDIDKVHALGYNGLRKHQKTEDERFLYWCDVKGMLVWSEFPSAYEYTGEASTEFARQWMECVHQNYNHPSIITWVPINESWGVDQIPSRRDQQHFTEALYHMTKSVDPQRPVIVNDGWEHTVSDILTLHDYEPFAHRLSCRYTEYKDKILSGDLYHCGDRNAFAPGYSYNGQPVIISEFGGIAFSGEQAGWGYGDKVADEQDFLRRFEAVTTAIQELSYVCGYCYTQVTDVQQEINGLMDIQRNYKVDPDAIREINQRKTGCLKRWPEK